MNAYAKKLLSWLCVAAMVFAMAPATMLPAFAEETEAAPEIQYGAANLPEGTQAIMDAAAAIQAADLAAHIAAGTCPICGAGVEWKEATYPNQTTNAGEKRHYYVMDTTEVQKKYNWYAGNAKDMTLCLALLNTTTPKEIGGMIGLRNQSSGCTLNIMGSGTITSDGKSTSDGQFGTICVQGANNTVNLYGGTFIYTGDGQGRTKVVTDNGDGTSTTTYTPSGVIGAAAISLKGYDNTVNIFDGVTIGPEEQDLSKQCFNLLVQLTAVKKANTVNMYGGTIRNGVSNLGNTSGNVHLHYDKEFTETGTKPTNPTFNMYGGTIQGGAFTADVKSANGGNMYVGPGARLYMYGGTITGGKGSSGGNIFANSSSLTKFNLSGGIIEKGEANNGGNIYSSAPVNLSGTALIRDGVATTVNGGNIYFSSTRTHTISGGKIAGGTAAKNGGNIYMEAKKVTVSGGIIENGTAAAGGNLYITGTNDATISGGIIQNGTASGSNGGGNLYGTGECNINITGGIIQDGKATASNGGGGNLRVNCTAVNIGGDAQILGGEASYMGGSIYITTKCVMTIDGDAIVSGGRSNTDGGNIAIYNGDLIIGGNAQIKDGRATRYTTKLNDAGKEVDGHISDGGNIYCYGYYEAVDEVKVYSNELTIKDSAVISGGWAVRGGNIVADNTTVNIESGVLIKDGCAGIEVDGEMTYEGPTDNVGRGGNIFHSTKECQVNIAATLSGGKGRYAGNLGLFGGTINFSGIMEKGEVTGFGGNACVQGATLNMTGAELREAVSGGQGGNIRVYNGTVNMNGGKIYGGDDLSKNNTDNVWLVRATLNMSGDATVQGNNAYGSAVRAVPYAGDPSVVSLADTASVTGETKHVLTIQANADGDQSILYIAEGWAGTAMAATEITYNYGDTIPDHIMVVGSFNEEGAFVKGGTYTGTLTNNNVDVFGVDGNVVVAAAGFFVDDENKTWFQTNDEAIAAYQHSETAYVLLTGETAQIPETISEINIRLSGKDVTVSGKATVYGSDKGNDDYDGAAKLIPAEGAELTVMPTATMAGGRRYIALQGEDGSWTFHRFVIALDTVTLRTEGNPGIYYKATYRCDDVLANLVSGYGVALSLQDMPGADFETEDKFTAYGAESFQAAYKNHVVKTTSGAVVGIMKERNSKETNTANANMDIFANAYLKLNVGGEELVVMADSDTAYSLFEVLQGVNENWDSYADEDKATIGAFLEKWAAFITDEAVALLQSTLDKIFPAA